MARNRTSASGGQDPIPVPASGNTIRGRGRRRARGWGRGRVATPVDVQVPVATQDRDRAVPPNGEVIHGDVQDRVEGDGPAQAPTSIIVPPVLQDTLARMLGILEGMAQAGALPVTFDGSQTRVGGQTPDLIVAPDSQTPRTQPAAVVAPHLDSMEFPNMKSHLVNSERERKRDEFEGLQQNGMSVAEYEGKFHALSRHASMILPTEAERVRRFVKGLIIPIRLGVSQVAASGVPFQKVVDAAKKSRGYLGSGYHPQSSRPIHAAIPASEAGYAGHNSSSSVHTSQGSSSRPLVRGGHSGHSGSSHQPASRRGCFECGFSGFDFQAAQPPARGGAQNGRGGSHLGRGGSPSGRGGGRGGSQSDGGRSRCYAFPGRIEAEASDAVITGSTYSYVSTYFSPSLDILCESVDLPICVSTPVEDSVVVDQVYRLCTVTLIGCDTHADLKVLDMIDFDVILDHRNLQYKFNQRDLNLRQKRWLELLKDYDMTILYHPGKENVVADALSRKAVSMGSLDMLQVGERPLARDVQSLANSFVRLDISESGKVLEDMLRACVIDFGGQWDQFLPLAEFAYNNSYHSSIEIAPFEALYDLLRESLDKVKLIQDRLLMAQSRQKSYADRKVRDLEFMVGERVLLKVSPMKGVMRFGKKGKLSPRYIGPFEIVERISEVAYQLALPPGLSGIHPVFHISMLKKYHQGGDHVIQWDSVLLDQNLTFEEESVIILDRQIRKLRSKEIASVKVSSFLFPFEDEHLFKW
ncbi:uncharacterized protein [Solanum lycopersicum]|uniref:uncharacterized protein n=1 Tax=Solanum lycopersicum TaxID=4081 RepID=UPI00374961DA